MPSVISLEDVSVAFTVGYRKAGIQALRGVDLQANPGEIVGVLGPNGAGKTTALRVLAGLQRPDQGRVSVLGQPAQNRSLCTRVGFQPAGPLPFPHLRGIEFLHYLGNLMRLPAATVRANATRWLDALQVHSADTLPIRHYSTGMQRRLALAAALFTEPEVLLLDEPSSGLDPEGTLLVLEILRERAAAGCAILMASHHMQEVEEVCDRVYLFADGQVLEHGRLEDLLATDATRLVIRDLSDPAVAALHAQIEAAGGTVVSQSPERENLGDYYRRRAQQASHTPGDHPSDQTP